MKSLRVLSCIFCMLLLLSILTVLLRLQDIEQFTTSLVSKEVVLANIPVNLIFQGFYDTSNPNLNLVDPVKKAAYDKAMINVNNLTTFINICRVTKNVADYAQVMRAMSAKNAFLGIVNTDSEQGLFVRNWRLSTIAFAYIVLSPLLSVSDRTTFQSYIQRYQNVILAKIKKLQWYNNHKVWELLGLILSSIALQKPITRFVNELVTFANSKTDNQGFISSEKRGYRTRNYHNFFLKPLLLSLAMNKAMNSLDTNINKNNLVILLNKIPKVIQNLKTLPINDWRIWLNANGEGMPASGDDNLYMGSDYQVSETLYMYIVFNKAFPEELNVSYLDNIAPFFNNHVHKPIV